MRAIHSPFAADRGWHNSMFIHLSCALLLVVLSCVPVTVWAQNAAVTADQSPTLESDVFLLKANSHYELAKLFFENGKVDEAVAEIRRIIQLRIPPEHEQSVVKCMTNVSNKLKQLRRFDAAQSLLDDTLKVIVQIPNRVELFKQKSALYYASGQDDKAIEAWKRAIAEEARQREGKFF
jgi:tetratricopeptide (TPR) repeat protein